MNATNRHSEVYAAWMEMVGAAHARGWQHVCHPSHPGYCWVFLSPAGDLHDLRGAYPKQLEGIEKARLFLLDEKRLDAPRCFYLMRARAGADINMVTPEMTGPYDSQEAAFAEASSDVDKFLKDDLQDWEVGDDAEACDQIHILQAVQRIQPVVHVALSVTYEQLAPMPDKQEEDEDDA